MKASVSKRYLSAVILFWAALIGVGMSKMASYENTPGPSHETPARWPQEAAVRLSPSHYSVVVFVHPQCPCTLATLEELSELMARDKPLVQTTVLVVASANKAKEWMQSKVVRDASAIPGVVVSADVGGVEARRFGALTSGFTVVYDQAGTLRFSGGITGARGQAGDNAGLNAVEDLVERKRADRDRTFVFGCGLHDPVMGVARK